MPAIAEPTVTPAATPTQPATSQPAPNPAAPIRVVPDAISSTAAPPKPGSARERIFKDLRKKAGIETPEDALETPATKPAKATADEGNAPDNDTEPQTQPAATDKKPKVNPWKLLDEYKAARAKAENELAEVRKLVPNEKARKEEMEKLQRYEARAKELEEEIRFVNFTKSQEYQDQYQKPYEKAWQTAMNELKELSITDDSGNSRAVTPNDMLELVNMPLGKAREAANTMFGEFADDVMAHRKEIRSLFDKQAAALEEARKTGEIRERERREMFERQNSEFQKFVSEAWKQANEEATNHQEYGKLFQPIEGDDEGNERLKKGYELVDKAFSENPADPNLTTEQRLVVIKRHAAVRNRAAAFGRLRYQNDKLAKELGELKEKLKQYETSTPTTSSVNAPASAEVPSGTVRAQIFGALHKLAKPV